MLSLLGEKGLMDVYYGKALELLNYVVLILSYVSLHTLVS